MASVRRRRPKATEAPEEPTLPHEVGYLWAIWNELHAARGSGGMAPNPISWTELAAYRLVADEPLEPWEARAIRAVDDVYLAGLMSTVTVTDGAAGAAEGG